MSGTYNGGDFTLGKDASFADFARIQEAQNAQAARNIAAWMGISQADLVRVASGGQGDSPSHSGGAVSAPAPTSGPGVPAVGSAPTSGPGVASVGRAPTRGAGVLGTGVAGAGTGAGNAGVFNLGGRVLPMQKEGKETVTAPTVFGHQVQVNRGISDAQVWENRYGDSEAISTLIGLGIMAGDISNEVWNTTSWAVDQVVPKEIQDKNPIDLIPPQSQWPFAIDWMGNGSVVTGNGGLVKR